MINKTSGFFTKTRIFLMIIGLFATPLISSAQYYYDNYNYPSNPLFVTTGNANFVTPSSATLNGTVNGSTNNLSTWFEYGTTPNFGLSTARFNYNYTNTNINATVGSLSSSTVYYFRAVAQNAWGVVYGNTNSFRTDFGNFVNPPVDNYYYPYNTQYTSVNTQPATLTAITSGATLVGTRSVDLNALIINTPGSTSSTWFEWGKDYLLSNTTPIVSINNLAQVKHVSTITQLAPGTTYYFRAVVINGVSRSNGTTLSFTTRSVATTPDPEPTTPKDTIEETKIQTGNLSASAIGSGFLPNNALEWVILAILVAILVILARNLYVKQ